MCLQMKQILLLMLWLTSYNFITGFSEVSPHTVKKKHVIIEDSEPEAIVLDCEYDAENYQSSLLVKWLKDGKPIYQWIKGHEPSVYLSSEELIDESFEASTNANYKHRAIKFPFPTKDISGNYSCLITMNTTQTFQIDLQVVDISRSNFELNSETSKNETRVTCAVDNVYPQPYLIVTSNEDNMTLTKISEEYEPENNGFYNATTIVSANGFDTNDVISCTLLFPGIEYNMTKTLTSSGSIIKSTILVFVLALLYCY
ncbi:uncharacterized protein LOC129907138 isoform X2 [Episyrphus balteatus]|uniref:uncharacterized protein LOC129907138 isoform X2 n=1 Tax=Episyrphus balteatus TaxID=286459 RepID=UPI002485AA26|nr:uncharacterized protein LOC129907138 isoform X2 [Episyrphus balteatus]